MAFLRREYSVVAIFVAALAVIFLLLPSMGWRVAISFVCGATLSLLAGFIGMRSATTSNARTAQAAQESEIAALRTAFTGGSVMGPVRGGPRPVRRDACYLAFQDTNILTGFSLGASLVALFSRVGGGIYTKAADVGADLVGKVEQGIPEDDPRNPAVIADNVGDNVGDVAGMGADLFESYVGAIVSSVTSASSPAARRSCRSCSCCAARARSRPCWASCTCACPGANDPQRTMMGGTYISMVLFIVAALVLDHLLLGSYLHFIAVLTGIVSGIVTGLSTEWYTSSDFRAVKSIVDKSRTGPATNILEGLSAGMAQHGGAHRHHRAGGGHLLPRAGHPGRGALCGGHAGDGLGHHRRGRLRPHRRQRRRHRADDRPAGRGARDHRQARRRRQHHRRHRQGPSPSAPPRSRRWRC